MTSSGNFWVRYIKNYDTFKASKQSLKTALTNPTGYEYVGGTLVKRGAALATEMATDGALGGAIDGGFRAGLDNDWDAIAS